MPTQTSHKQRPSQTIAFQKRVIIEGVYPEINGGEFPIKRVPGESILVSADIYADGHDEIQAQVLHRKVGEEVWHAAAMALIGNDRFEGYFTPTQIGLHEYSIRAWVSFFKTWQHGLQKKMEAGEYNIVDLQIGIQFLEKHFSDRPEVAPYIDRLRGTGDLQQAARLALDPELLRLVVNIPDRDSMVEYKSLKLTVDPPRALFSSWYELFPRSWGHGGSHGTFQDAAKLLPEISRMGFNVVYLPPIYPIGKTFRKGKNNSSVAQPGDPGSPWAIGSEEGGFTSIHSELGTLDDFEHFRAHAEHFDIQIALDIAFQCSPDHPWVKEHPEWFTMRPDGTIQYAENPPKKYQDVYPLNFQSADAPALWKALKDVFFFWIDRGVTIFRVDNPHTKPFEFWQWAIPEIKRVCPEAIFLSEAFTRPVVMKRLAKLGFTQSYTYFTWRNSKWEFEQYIKELTHTEMREYFRPNFWPNTPDILAHHLQYAGRPVFIQRLILAATLSSNYGIYGPAYELCVNEPMPGKEEYLHSEKYELKQWNWDQPGNIKDVIVQINHIRQTHPALQTTFNIKFCETNNEHLLAYYKTTPGNTDTVLVVANMNVPHKVVGSVRVPLSDLGLDPYRSYKVVDLMTQNQYHWHGEWNYIELNPYVQPAHIFEIRRS